MRFLIALTLLATVYGSIPDECAWGDSYTCSSLASAHKCGTFDHCMNNVWKDAQLEKDTTDVCQFCEAIIKDVRDFIDDKNNQDEVKTFLTNACNIIPDETLADLCKTSVTEEFDELIKMIDSELDPATVCSAMGLCSGFKKPVLKKSPLKEGTDVCEFCEAVVKDIRAFVDDKNNQNEVKDMLKTVCKLISDQEIANLCMTAVDDEIDTLIQMMDSELDPAEVCKAIQACTAEKQATKEKNSDMCPECTKFFMEIKSKLSDASTEKELQELIEEELCQLMGQYAAVCKVGVEAYLPQILKMLADDVDPKVICQSLGFCDSTPEARALLAKYTLQSSKIHGAVQAGRAGGAEECLLCKTVLGELQNLERSEAVQKDVEDFLKKDLCGLMGTLQAVCESTVDEYGPELFELLVTELDPETRCSAMGFCSAKSVEAILRAAVPKSPPPKVPAAPKVSSPAVEDPSTQCVLCEFVIQTLDKQLGDNATEEEIIKALDEVCEALPDTLRESCEQFVADYGPTVIALLLQELDPQQVCTKLGLCTSVGAAPQCVLCEFVMSEIDQILDNNSTEAEIIAALDKVCQVLPSSVTQDCLEFVNMYGPAVIALLEQELQPSEICAILGLCPKQKERLMLQKATFAGDEECGICETVIQYLDSLIEENATIVEIEQALDKICNFLPDTMKKQCDDFVKQYGPAIIQMLANSMDPKQICTAIGLCSQAEKESVKMEAIVPAKANLVGTNECTYGPAFWCVNMDNAVKCNAVEHCKLKVWN